MSFAAGGKMLMTRTLCLQSDRKRAWNRFAEALTHVNR
jgi:hypothetical protein